VVRPDHLGDLLFATPALARLRVAFPQAHITGLVAPWGKAMWDSNPDLNEVRVIRFPGIVGGQGGTLAPYQLLRQEARSLSREKYDLGIVLRFDHWWGAALLAAAGIPRRWGYDTPGMGAWLTDAVPYVGGRHEVEQNLTLVEAVLAATAGDGTKQLPQLMVDRNRGVPALRPPRSEKPLENFAEGWLRAPRRAVIHPGTASANKLWTLGGWAEVIRQLLKEGWEVALTGSPEEAALCRYIEMIAAEREDVPTGDLDDPSTGEFAPLPGVCLAAGKTQSLAQLVRILECAHMVIGVDNGPLHIADALGKPTLHLYGPSDETTWGPWGDPRKHRALRAPGARPSMLLDVGKRGFEGGPEMRAITVEMVIEEIHALEKHVR
jgi:ADP-heptose:LPS heptosyltransferase